MSSFAIPQVCENPAQASAMPSYLALRPNLVAVCFSLMKLLPALALTGAAPPGSDLIESSSGTMGLALAVIAAWRRRALTLVTPSLQTDLRNHIQALGNTTIIEVAGDQRARLRALRSYMQEHRCLHWTNQYASPLVLDAYAPVAADLIALDVDTVVVTVGSGGSASGVGSYMRARNRHARLIAIDAMNSVLFGREDGVRQVAGIGNSLVPRNLDHSLVDHVHWLSDAVMMAAARRVARDHGLFLGPTGAIALLIASWHAKREPERRFAAILPDQGHRYVSTVFATEADRSVKSGAADVIEHLVTGEALVASEDWRCCNWARRSQLSGVSAKTARATGN